MRERMQTRLSELQTELAKGQAELEKVERQQRYLHDTLLQIRGAIRVLEELLAPGPPAADAGGAPGGPHPTGGPPSATARADGARSE